MFKKLFKNKIAQTTAEYALLIALVVAAVIAMQTYAQRAIQARIRDAAIYMANQTSTLGNSTQYEAYYTQTSYNIERDSSDTTTMAGNSGAQYKSDESRKRLKGGYSNVTMDGMTLNGI